MRICSYPKTVIDRTFAGRGIDFALRNIAMIFDSFFLEPE